MPLLRLIQLIIIVFAAIEQSKNPPANDPPPRNTRLNQ